MPNKKHDDKNLFYRVTNTNNQLRSFGVLAGYISKASSSIILLSEKGRNCLGVEAGIIRCKSFRFQVPLGVPVKGNILEHPGTPKDHDISDKQLLPEFSSPLYFAAVPLVNPDHEFLGYLTLQGQNPCSSEQDQKAALMTLADQLAAFLDTARQTRELKGHVDGQQKQLIRQQDDMSAQDCYNKLYERAREFDFILDNEGKIKYTNPATPGILGYIGYTFTGRHIDHLPVWRNAYSIFEQIREGLSRGQNRMEFESKMITSHQKTKWVSWVSRFQEDNWLLTGRDITAQKELDQEYGQLWMAKNLDQGITISDIKGNVIWINPAFTALTGYTLPELAGKRIGDVLRGPDTDIMAIDKSRRESLRYQTSVTEILAYPKTGDPYWISVSKSLVLGQDDQVDRVIEIFADITEKKKKEIEIETLATVAERTSSGITVLDRSGKLIWMNKAFEEISGYKFQEIVGKNRSTLQTMFTHDKTDLLVKKRVNEAINNQKPYQVEAEIRRKDQTSKWVLINGTPIFDGSGKLERMVNLTVDITDRKIAELLLVKYSHVVNQSSNAIIIKDLNGKTTWVNDSYTRYFGYSSEDAIGTPYFDLLSGPKTEQTKIENIASKIRAGEEESLDLTLYHKDGSPISIIGTLKPIVAQDGILDSVVCILTDISESKRAEAEIKKLSMVATESPAGVLIRDIRGITLWVNKAFLSIFGYQAGELIGKDIRGLFIGPDTDMNALDQASNTRLKGGEVDTELLVYKKDGSPVWIHVLTYPVLNDQGDVESMVTHVTDITKRKDTDREVHLLSLVASNTRTGVVINNQAGQALWCNPSFEKMSGYIFGELKGKRTGNLLKGPDTDLKELKAIRNLSIQKKAYNTELLCYKKNGTPFWLSIASTPVLDDNGRLMHQVDILEDITGRKEAGLQLIKVRDEALHLSKAKEMFLSVMSHEIRTPLNTVNGITQLLLDDNPTKSQLDYLKLLKFSGENLSTLINDILDLTKMETGNLTLEEATVNLHELLFNTISSLQVKANENATELVLTIGEKVPVEIKGDAVRLYQILMNLAGNSIKFTRKGKVNVSLKLMNETNTTVQIGFEVADTGIGIPEDKLETIFEAYTQASADTTRKFGGTGLGLTITRNLLKIHGSKIQVSSTVGKGSTFSFNIEFNKVSTTTTVAPNQRPISSLPILVVDDSEISRKIAQRLLRGLYERVDFAENGEIAVRKIRETRYACVLMDVFMPVMDGIEATTRIRSLQDPYFKDLYIIALTGSTDESDLQKIKNCGMNGHIVKPLSADKLTKILAYSS